MLVSMWGWHCAAAEGAEPAVLLVLWRDRVEAMLKRLRMFVLRAKVTLTDVSDELAIHGLLGDTATAAAPDLSLAWQRAHRADGADVVRLPPAVLPAGDELARALWVAPAGQVPDGPALPLADWLTAEAWSGVAPVMTATAEAFVPQMLNYESVGGVNFKKGCYPGQEIVARSQFRGTLKQRAFVGLAHGPAQNGDEVWTTGDDAGPVGTVALASPANSNGDGHWVIASLKLSAVDAGTPLAIGSATGPALDQLGLPYKLAEDI
jgi:folate-binding protein YgfZ